MDLNGLFFGYLANTCHMHMCHHVILNTQKRMCLAPLAKNALHSLDAVRSVLSNDKSTDRCFEMVLWSGTGSPP